jgi:hypothetical protein
MREANVKFCLILNHPVLSRQTQYRIILI